MRRIKSLFFTVVIFSLVSMISVSCASNKLTDTFGQLADLAQEAGMESSTVNVLRAAESVSRATEDITPENEYYIGRSVAASLMSAYSVYDNVALEEYVNLIAQALLVNSEEPTPYIGYHLKILNSDEINAFATTGGHIFITRGLINCAKTEDALAAAIAHEISHVQLKHGTAVIRSSRISDAATKSVSAYLSTLEDYKDIAEVMDSFVNDQINMLVTKGYSKTQEFDADLNAIKLMDKAGYNPSEILSLLEVMDKTQGDDAGGMFKTHPAPKERIKAVKKELKKLKSKNQTSSFRTGRFYSITY